jgi:hypothetical protein
MKNEIEKNNLDTILNDIILKENEIMSFENQLKTLENDKK